MPTSPPRTSRPARRRTTTVAAALSALALLTACAGPPRGTDPADLRLSVTTPAARGELDSLTWALYAEPPTLDPTMAFDYPQNTVLANVCESLMTWTPRLTVEPGLARAVSHPDATTWVYDLRPGVRFHNGGEMTADDVVFSLRRQMDPANAAAWAQVFRNVASVTADGPLRVTVRLTRPDSQFPQYMATAAGVVTSRAGVEAAGEDYGTSGGLACTGPFELTAWDKGQSLRLTRFAGYRGTPAKARTVTFRVLADPSARTNAMLSGEVDGSFLVPSESLARLRASGAGTLWYGEGLSTVNLAVTDTSGPLGDPRVRRALSLALDRDGFVRAGLGGAGTVTTAPTTRAAWAAAPAAARERAFAGLPAPGRDLAEARRLVAEAGAKGGRITVATSPIGQDVSLLATAVQAAGTSIGLDVRLRTIAPNAFTALFTDPAAREGIDMFPLTYYQSITDPLDLLGNFRGGAYLNFSGHTDPAYDRLVDRAGATADPAERAGIEADLHRRAARDLLWIPVAEWPTSLFLGKRVTGAAAGISHLYRPWAADIGAAP
ncbi:ABC transporter substrate-binding protein (plasmid) [Streptomyces sp. BI20]|uniref:ABC transporter substrate-binding protein n=1 Tax=Streptomyces sp. BI20 TaxID=3403460 RepID=UPI003C73F678